jgi:hypothetical protein
VTPTRRWRSRNSPRTSQLRIERGEGLVQQQKVRLEHDGTGQCDSLPFSTGELGRPPRGFRLQPDLLQYLLDPSFKTRYAFAPEAEFDISLDGQVREKRVALEDRVDVALVRRERIDPPAVEPHLARGGRFKAGDHPKNRGFAAAGWPQQREKPAAWDFQGDIRYGTLGGRTRSEILCYAAERQHRLRSHEPLTLAHGTEMWRRLSGGDGEL